MRELVRRVISEFKSVQLQGQNEGYVLFIGREPDTREKVSIKILPRMLESDPGAERAFESTARAIRQLNHPNLVPVRKVGQEGGLPYLVTRAIETGQSLTDRLQKGWTVDEAADAVIQIGHALEHAYNKGVVHGALTPEDVIVQDDGRILVADVGMADLRRLVGATAKQVASPFIAPEVQQGVRGDARADVYSLAAILYRMLAGRPPQVVKGEVMPPGRFSADVPPEMDQVLTRALAPDPNRRYPDVKAFVAALGGVKIVPAAEQPQRVTPGGHCPKCGAENQTGRFCRKCGSRLAQPEATPARSSQPARPPQKITPPRRPERSVLDEPIQITRIEVGRIEVGSGVEVEDTVIAQPIQVASSALDVEFPAPLDMPRLDLDAMWPATGDGLPITMPAPPPMPEVDWAEIAPPMPEVPTIEDIPIAEVQRREEKARAREAEALVSGEKAADLAERKALNENKPGA
ncbi:MAG: protein kinase [Anaerolineae bacterium]|nr:protein kinase [Anaerolineae bacterium]